MEESEIIYTLGEHKINVKGNKFLHQELLSNPSYASMFLQSKLNLISNEVDPESLNDPNTLVKEIENEQLKMSMAHHEHNLYLGNHEDGSNDKNHPNERNWVQISPLPLARLQKPQVSHASRGKFVWDNITELMLINAYGDRLAKFRSGKYTLKHLYGEIAQHFAERKYVVTGLQLQKKMNKMRGRLRTHKAAVKHTGNGTPATWDLLPQMEILFHDDESVQMRNPLSNMKNKFKKKRQNDPTEEALDLVAPTASINNDDSVADGTPVANNSTATITSTPLSSASITSTPHSQVKQLNKNKTKDRNRQRDEHIKAITDRTQSIHCLVQTQERGVIANEVLNERMAQYLEMENRKIIAYEKRTAVLVQSRRKPRPSDASDDD